MLDLKDLFSSRYNHEYWMKEPLRLAQKAFEEGEVPVGAIIVKDNQIIGRGYNQRERLNDPTAHAEILAITAATGTLKDWRLTDCILYVTKEPCPMCAGAIINSRVNQLIFGAYDEEKGCCGSLYQLCGDRRLDSRTAVKGGVEEVKCASILKEFFQSKRNK
ncbi:MAG: nucleoside deaminase [Candidatus Marinimicrobia bacterium]|jgi:tRNA(adenine34) deaminase|nr:nucleoside deaminase [Candidatus Neomarinimicrobiota bacterium]MBT3502348.1 nucleoside deaminase [Candidatus Neomarinimicrobiota bacterium]MBT3839366.1 nucleoside deaminase [Candidatus Neomarinimicrobiota bacterium]MBT4000394.1 nucleoside deaminase [Candidatus Neomarinimicrobiota bacterium]MBT4283526.1 nucleoside deaminase [Candidatus Neomarinimicrobiota bacterium]